VKASAKKLKVDEGKASTQIIPEKSPAKFAV
jgi:hypothetical protein